MSDDVENTFQSVLKIVSKAENDSEKFASLLIVTKALKADSCTPEQRNKIFKTIGFSFPLRLLSSNKDKEHRLMFVQLAISILASFATDKELVQAPEMQQALPDILNTLGSDFDGLEFAVVQDCLQIVCSVSEFDYGCKKLLRLGAIERLAKVYSKSDSQDTKDLSFIAMLHIINHDKTAVWESNKLHLQLVVNALTDTVCGDKESTKFNYITHLSDLLQTLQHENVYTLLQMDWLVRLTTTIVGVLKSRITEKERRPTLGLCHTLVKIYGLKWMLPKEKHPQFHILLPRLAAIEISMLIYDQTTVDKDQSALASEEKQLLLSCFEILEFVCADIARFDQEEDDTSFYNFEDIKSLDQCLSDTAKMVQDYATECLKDKEREETLLVCLRFLGAWLNVEPFANSDVGVSMADTVCQLLDATMEKHENWAINLCGPALMIYIENPRTVECIAESGIAKKLCDCLDSRQCNQDIKLIAAQCIMAFSLQEKGWTQLVGCLHSLLHVALEKHQPDNIDFQLTVATTVLIIFNRVPGKVKKYPDAKRFYQSVVSILHGLHSVTGSGVKLATRYQTKSHEVEQLLPIFTKEFTDSILKEHTFRELVKTSGLLGKIENLILAKSELGVNEILGYQNILAIFHKVP